MKILKEQIDGLTQLDSANLKGGWRSVQSKAEMEAIPEGNRESGMQVYVVDENVEYQYKIDETGNGIFEPMMAFKPITAQELSDIFGESPNLDPIYDNNSTVEGDGGGTAPTNNPTQDTSTNTSTDTPQNTNQSNTTQTIDMDALKADVVRDVLKKTGVLQRGVTYTLGDRVFAAEGGSINEEWILECSESGTTGLPNIVLDNSMEAGAIIEDGSAKWKLLTLRCHLENYYTKAEVDSRINANIEELDRKISNINTENYYSKAEIDTKFSEIGNNTQAATEQQPQVTTTIDAYTKAEIDEKQEAIEKRLASVESSSAQTVKAKLVKLNLLTLGWATTSKTYKIDDVNIKEDSVLIMTLRAGATQDQAKAYQKADIYCESQENGSVTLVSYGILPATDIPATLIIM